MRACSSRITPGDHTIPSAGSAGGARKKKSHLYFNVMAIAVPCPRHPCLPRRPTPETGDRKGPCQLRALFRVCASRTHASSTAAWLRLFQRRDRQGAAPNLGRSAERRRQRRGRSASRPGNRCRWKGACWSEKRITRNMPFQGMRCLNRNQKPECEDDVLICCAAPP